MAEIERIVGAAAVPESIRRNERTQADADKFKDEMQKRLSQVHESDAEEQKKRKQQAEEEEEEEIVQAEESTPASQVKPFDLQKQVNPLDLDQGRKISPIASSRSAQTVAPAPQPYTVEPASTEEGGEEMMWGGGSAQIFTTPSQSSTPSTPSVTGTPAAQLPTSPQIPLSKTEGISQPAVGEDVPPPKSQEPIKSENNQQQEGEGNKPQAPVSISKKEPEVDGQTAPFPKKTPPVETGKEEKKEGMEAGFPPKKAPSIEIGKEEKKEGMEAGFPSKKAPSIEIGKEEKKEGMEAGFPPKKAPSIEIGKEEKKEGMESGFPLKKAPSIEIGKEEKKIPSGIPSLKQEGQVPLPDEKQAPPLAPVSEKGIPAEELPPAEVSTQEQVGALLEGADLSQVGKGGEKKDVKKMDEGEKEAIETATSATFSPKEGGFESGSEKRKEGKGKEVQQGMAFGAPPPFLMGDAAPAAGLSPPPPYTSLPNQILEIFERMAGVMMVMTDSTMTETTITLNAPQFASSVFYGSQIIIREYASAPKAFNIEFNSNPQGVALFQGNVDGLMAAFQYGQYRFRVNRLDTGHLSEKPLFHRKEKVSKDKDPSDTGP
ncbi:MAG: hypothetical protein HYZ48_04935 [Chlamydiales bacterium]|nr:hypothetical protein [Chlamydiales bacterium]